MHAKSFFYFAVQPMMIPTLLVVNWREAATGDLLVHTISPLPDESMAPRLYLLYSFPSIFLSIEADGGPGSALSLPQALAFPKRTIIQPLIDHL